ncbi:MAG: hypothetical protein JXA73_19460 [Acidobacteria bacterium]|nr:hypothetical protein [Acidobacteriota bacterium]
MAESRTSIKALIFYGISFFIIALVLAVVINWTYPISYEYELRRRPMELWFAGYTLSVAVLSAFIIVTSVLWSKWQIVHPGRASFFAALTIFVAISAYCFAVVKRFPSKLGLSIIDIMNAKFLAEWQFLAFIVIIAPICAVLSGILTWIRLKYMGRLPHSNVSSKASA